MRKKLIPSPKVQNSQVFSGTNSMIQSNLFVPYCQKKLLTILIWSIGTYKYKYMGVWMYNRRSQLIEDINTCIFVFLHVCIQVIVTHFPSFSSTPFMQNIHILFSFCLFPFHCWPLLIFNTVSYVTS